MTIAILGIIATLSGVTSNALHKTTLETTTNKLFHTLNLARTHAINSNCYTHICQTNNFSQCLKGTNVTTETTGIMAFTGSLANPTVIYTQNIANRIQLDFGKAQLITFTPYGLANTRKTIKLSNENSEHKLIIYNSGRVRRA